MTITFAEQVLLYALVAVGMLAMLGWINMRFYKSMIRATIRYCRNMAETQREYSDLAHVPDGSHYDDVGDKLAMIIGRYSK